MRQAVYANPSYRCHTRPASLEAMPRLPLTRNFILHARTFRPPPHIFQEIEAIWAELVGELRILDEQVQTLTFRRLEIVEELRRCRDAFGRYGYRFDGGRIPLPAEVNAVPEGTHVVAGLELREMVTHLLRESDRPLTLSEIHRGLLACGLNTAGRPSKTLSDALRAEVKAGRVVRTRRGTYSARRTGGAGG